jgi:hypothetical protein
VLYAGTCCTGTALWSTQTAQPPLRGVAGVAGATGTVGAVSVPVPVPEDGSDFVQAKTVNHDYFIANRAFFFDLSVWGDETPNDEPWQPLGSDRAALRALLGAAQAAATVASGGESTMIHMGGFTPWHFKYVAEGICGAAKCKHSGVPTEWETMEVASGYNVFADADACCTVGTMANAALWQHYPLPAKLAQPFSPPTVAALQARGLVGADGRTVAGKAFAAYYAGDYDSAAWAYNELLDNFDDGSADRGKTPIGWAVDPELSLRFPPVFARLWAAATPNDVFISGDSGAGYVNPTRLPDGGAAWGETLTPCPPPMFIRSPRSLPASSPLFVVVCRALEREVVLEVRPELHGLRHQRCGRRDDGGGRGGLRGLQPRRRRVQRGRRPARRRQRRRADEGGGARNASCNRPAEGHRDGRRAPAGRSVRGRASGRGADVRRVPHYPAARSLPPRRCDRRVGSELQPRVGGPSHDGNTGEDPRQRLRDQQCLKYRVPTLQLYTAVRPIRSLISLFNTK